MFQRFRPHLIGLLSFILFAGAANAAVVLGGTRIVYPADAREVSLSLDNTGKRAALVQAWIDDGSAASTPDTANAPFLLTPPIFRMEPGQSQVLRILHTSPALPSDRESVFWLNVLDVPPKPKQAEAQNVLQFALRNRIKLFYRPTGLAGSAATAPSTLTWKTQNENGHLYLEVTNPSPYFISLSTIELEHDGIRAPRIDQGPAMVAPMSSTRFEFGADAASAAKVHYTTINDHGARNASMADLGT